MLVLKRMDGQGVNLYDNNGRLLGTVRTTRHGKSTRVALELPETTRAIREEIDTKGDAA